MVEDGEVLVETLRLLEEATALVAVYDGEDRLRYANRAFREAFFVEAGERVLWSQLMRRNHHAGRGTIVETDDIETWLHSTQARRGKITSRAFETDLYGGRWLWMTETVQSSGWMVSIATDITSIRTSQRALRKDRDKALRASQTDELTGLPNRRYVMAALESLLTDRGAGEDRTCCLAILDIDHFKQINDNFGHKVGDLVLKDFASRLAPCLRKSDIVGRVGGEEFVLILPRASLENAAGIVQRMLESIREARPAPDHPMLQYTFSAGIARAAPGEHADTLLQRADRALYAAKFAGRNQARTAA